MNFFESLMEGIEDDYNVEVGTGLEIDADLSAEMESAEMEQGIEVMEANKFLATVRLAEMPLEKACLEAELEGMDAFFLGENVLTNAKDKVLELWEKFKEWVQGILAKVKVFFAKFAISRKQIAQLETQYAKAAKSTKFENAKKHLGISVATNPITKAGMDKVFFEAVQLVSKDLTQANVESLKKLSGEMSEHTADTEKNVKDYIQDNSFSSGGISALHTSVVKTIGNFVKGLESTLKASQTAQRKYDRLGAGKDPKNDSEAITQVRSIINSANRIYAAAIKVFFHEVRITKNLISYVGKEADLTSSEKKDTGKIKGMTKF